MAGTDVDARLNSDFTETLAIAVMRLWAAAIQIEQSFGQVALQSPAGLQRTINAARHLPSCIGWTASAPYDTDL